MLAPIRTVAPETEPLSLAEVKLWCRADAADDDAIIAALITAVTVHLDGWAGTLNRRCLIEQTWTQSFAEFCDPLRLALEPVSSVTSVKYYDSNNVEQTLGTSVYRLLRDVLGPKVTRKSDQSWPSVYCREDAVTVTFVAGYGPTATDVPEPIRQAMKPMIAARYDNRELTAEENDDIDRLLAPYRNIPFA